MSFIAINLWQLFSEKHSRERQSRDRTVFCLWGVSQTDNIRRKGWSPRYLDLSHKRWAFFYVFSPQYGVSEWRKLRWGDAWLLSDVPGTSSLYKDFALTPQKGGGRSLEVLHSWRPVRDGQKNLCGKLPERQVWKCIRRENISKKNCSFSHDTFQYMWPIYELNGRCFPSTRFLIVTIIVL